MQKIRQNQAVEADLDNMPEEVHKNQVTMQNAIKFNPLTLNNLEGCDKNLKHVNLQNGKLWALTQKNEIIVRADLTDVEM